VRTIFWFHAAFTGIGTLTQLAAALTVLAAVMMPNAPKCGSLEVHVDRMNDSRVGTES